MSVASLVRVRPGIYSANRTAGVRIGAGPSEGANLSSFVKNPRTGLAAGVFLGTNTYVKVIGVRQRGYGRDDARGSSVAQPERESPDQVDDSAV